MSGLPPGVDPSQVPLAANPSGAPPNFVDPPSLIVAVQVVGIVLAVISLILVTSRLVLGYRLKRPFGLDDGRQLLEHFTLVFANMLNQPLLFWHGFSRLCTQVSHVPVCSIFRGCLEMLF
jgi:hypothetical protein